ncbi:hypothetical protein [Pantoea sp. 1B4]|uniref:hypothetical protein n=1 Tax=Pantoea sp. 1B4 TaxID=2804760 RepID=UPI001AA3B970|nr:hypothetical protein [Pantoea sp. 1B4]MBN1088115.1 hypothetical protein [Pantoea sp. 1B4]
MTVYYGNQQRGSQVGGQGSEPVPNKLSVGSVITLSPGTKAAVEITGDAPAQVINFSLPAGKDGTSPTLKIGKVTTLAAGSQATASIGGTAPDYTVDFGIPKGDAGTNATPVQFEVVSGAVATAGQKVAVTFAKKYSTPPVVLPNAIWNGQQLIQGQASEITTTGCNVTVMQSRGTLLLSSGSFESAAAKAVFSMFVIGS